MQDRVAEVLAQRAALGNGTAAAVVLSILLHGGVTTAAVWAALHQPPPQMASTLNIKFAKMPAATPMQPAAPAAPKPETPRIEEPKPEPVKPVKTQAPPEKNTVPISPFGRSRKKGSENPVTAPTRSADEGARTSTAEPGIGQTGVTGLEGGDFPYTLYIERMKTIVGTHWFRPQLAGGGKVIVYFVIQRDGTIRDARVEESSGNPTFDRAALRAVLESSPMPTLPFGYSGTYLGVHLTFR